MLAETDALADGIEVELVDFALIGSALPGGAVGRIADELAAMLEHQDAVTRPYGAAPPLGRALQDHAVEVEMGDDAAIGIEPGLAEYLRQRCRIGRLPGAYTHLGARTQHGLHYSWSVSFCLKAFFWSVSTDRDEAIVRRARRKPGGSPWLRGRRGYRKGAASGQRPGPPWSGSARARHRP